MNTFENKFEEHFVAYIDFLGFSEASKNTDEAKKNQILDLLNSLSTLRGEFSIESDVVENGRRFNIRPAISSFSDHIVISYPIKAVADGMEFKESVTAHFVMHEVNSLITRIAASALSLGILIRGGATIGNLYHSNGVVFGEALVEAYMIESKLAVYPRVVLSPNITKNNEWMKASLPGIRKSDDGIYYFDCFSSLITKSFAPGGNWVGDSRSYFSNALAIIEKNLIDHKDKGEIRYFSKWAWFANELCRSLKESNPLLINAMQISLDPLDEMIKLCI